MKRLVINIDGTLTTADTPDYHEVSPNSDVVAALNDYKAQVLGCLSRKTGLAMAFRLMISARAKWRKLDGANRLPEIVEGIAFKDGIKQPQTAA